MIHLRLIPLFQLPLSFNIIQLTKLPDSIRRQICRPQGSCFIDDRNIYRNPENIRLELHQKFIDTCTAVYSHHLDVNSGISYHDIQIILHLISNAFQRRPDNLFSCCPACQTYHRSPCILIPVRRCQTRECRNKVNPARIGNALCHLLRFRRLRNNLQLVPQPLNRGTRNINTSVQCKGHLVAIKPPSDRCQQPVFGKNRHFTGVHQHKTSCAIGCLYCPGIKTSLSE